MISLKAYDIRKELKKKKFYERIVRNMSCNNCLNKECKGSEKRPNANIRNNPNKNLIRRMSHPLEEDLGVYIPNEPENSSNSSNGTKGNQTNNTDKTNTSTNNHVYDTEEKEMFDNIKKYKQSEEYRNSIGARKSGNVVSNKYPNTSPKTPENNIITEQKNNNYIVTKSEIRRFISKNNSTHNTDLSVLQEQALYKINDYANNEKIKNCDVDKPIILFFEGAGEYKGEPYARWIEKNPQSAPLYPHDPHPKGRYGAMVVVVKNNMIVYVSTNASTLPDVPLGTHIEENGTSWAIPTILPGVYDIESHYHGGKYLGFKTGIDVSKSRKVPVYRHKGDRTSNEINIHPGWYNLKTTEKPSSFGCLTVGYWWANNDNYSNDYESFAEAAGLNIVTEGEKDKNAKYPKKIKIKEDINPEDVTGIVVVDRTLVDRELMQYMYKDGDVVDELMKFNNNQLYKT